MHRLRTESFLVCCIILMFSRGKKNFTLICSWPVPKEFFLNVKNNLVPNRHKRSTICLEGLEKHMELYVLFHSIIIAKGPVLYNSCPSLFQVRIAFFV